MRFVLVDRFVELEPGRRAVATKTFSEDEDFFADHFPGFPVVPGVLLTEAMGQTAGWLLAYDRASGVWPLLTLVDRARFHGFLRPGEEVLLEATVTAQRGPDFDVRAEARASGRRVADARLLFHVFSAQALGLSAADTLRLSAWAARTLEELGAAAAAAGRP